MGVPIIKVTKGGVAVTEAANKLGMPVTVSTNGLGLAVTVVAKGGIPVISTGGGSVPLPALPLAAGAKVLVAGHSYTAANIFTGVSSGSTLNNITSQMTGVNSWLQALDARYNLDVWGNYDTPYPNGGEANRASAGVDGANQGIGGDQFVASDLGLGQVGFGPRIPYFKQLGPGIVVTEIGINDFVPIRGNQNAATVIARADACFSEMERAGIYVVAPSLMPVSSAWIPDGDSRLADLDTYNAWLAARATDPAHPGFRYVDLTGIFGAASGRPAAGVHYDGLHPTDWAARLVAAATHDVLKTMVSSGEFRSRDPSVSNSYPRAALAGTGGTLSSGGTGVIADGFTFARASGDATVVASKEAGTFNKQVFVVTPGASTSRFTMNLAAADNPLLSTLSWSVGDWVQSLVYIEMSDWAAGWVRATHQSAAGTSAAALFASIAHRSRSNTLAQIGSGALAFWSVGTPFQIPATSDRIRLSGAGALLDFIVLGGAAGTGTIKVSKPILRRVTDPRAVWNRAA